MKSMIDALIEAAALARKAGFERSSSLGPTQLGDLKLRRVDIFVTEIGFVVTGKSEGDGYRAGNSIEIQWPEFDANAELPANAVRLVRQRLEETERSWK